MNEIKLSPTPSPELDEEYRARRHDVEMDHNACRRHMKEDLIYCNHLEIEERNLNLCIRQLDVRETHLCRRECRCNRCETEVCIARLRGIGTGRGSRRG
jgi:hypothetical protein